MLGFSPKRSYFGKFEQNPLHCCLDWVRETEKRWAFGKSGLSLWDCCGTGHWNPTWSILLCPPLEMGLLGWTLKGPFHRLPSSHREVAVLLPLSWRLIAGWSMGYPVIRKEKDRIRTQETHHPPLPSCVALDRCCSFPWNSVVSSTKRSS